MGGGEDPSPQHGLHFHTAVYFRDYRDTGNLRKWREKLLKGIKCKDDTHALVIKHDCTFVQYLGYASKDGVCESQAGVTEADMVEGKKEYAMYVEQDTGRRMRMTTTMISNGRLMMFRAWARRSGAQPGEEDDWLALRRFYSAEHSFNPSEEALETFLSQLPTH